MGGRERGQVLPLIAVVIVLAGLVAMGLGRLGKAAVVRAQARTAADAAALAGAAAGEQAARDLAVANGGRLGGYRELGRDRAVEVSLGRARETARARREGGEPLAGLPPAGRPGTSVGRVPAGATGGLAPAMHAALARAAQLLGGPVPVTSGYRSPAQQAALWARRLTNPYPAAPPGSSMHERGLAVDVPAGFVPRLAAVAPLVGLCRPYPQRDPVHFEVCRGG